MRKVRVLAAAAVVIGGVFAYTAHAHAFVGWCFDDPVVQIGNEMVQTTVGVWGDPSWVSAHVRSATITYHLPSSVHGAKVKSTTTPYFAENVVFVYDQPAALPGQPVTAAVTVTFSTDAVGAGVPAQMVNTAQDVSKGPQTAPEQGIPFTLTSFGDTAAGIAAFGVVPQSITASGANVKH